MFAPCLRPAWATQLVGQSQLQSMTLCQKSNKQMKTHKHKQEKRKKKIIQTIGIQSCRTSIQSFKETGITTSYCYLNHWHYLQKNSIMLRIIHGFYNFIFSFILSFVHSTTIVYYNWLDCRMQSCALQKFIEEKHEFVIIFLIN